MQATMTFLIVAFKKNTKYSVCITFKNHYGPSKIFYHNIDYLQLCNFKKQFY